MNKIDNVQDFLLQLAKHADVKRFYPFPDALRIDDIKTDKTLPDKLQPYTDTDSNRLAFLLSDLTLESQDELSLKLLKYILDIPVQIAFHGHSIHPNISEYQFRYDRITERLRDTISPKRWYLFHGSKLGNWHSIIRNGICNMSKTNLMTTGAVYGNGVYLTDNFQIASQYGSSSKHTCIAVVELFEDPTKYKKVPGIYVVPNDKLLIPRYLFHLSKRTYLDSKPILEYYTKMKNSMLNQKIPKSRLEFELKEIKEIDTSAIYDDVKKNLTVYYKGIIFEVYMHKFPYAEPIIKSKYVLNKRPPKFNSQLVYAQYSYSPIKSIKDIFLSMDLSGIQMEDTENEINYNY